MANELPYFKPSGSGLLVDLKNLKVSETVSMGWYRGQISSLAPQLFGYNWVNGVYCYGWKFNIDDNLKFETNKGHAGRIQRWLKLFGVEEEDYAELHDIYRNDGVQHTRFIFKEQLEYDEADFDFVYNKLKSEISNNDIVKIEITAESERYSSDVPQSSRLPSIISSTRSPKRLGEEYFETHDDEGIMYNDKWEHITIGGQFRYIINPEYLEETSSIKLYDSLDNDVSSSLSINARVAIKHMLFMCGSSFLPFDGIVKTGESSYDRSTESGTYTYYQVSGTETYNTSSFGSAKGLFPYFELKEYENRQPDNGDSENPSTPPVSQSSSIYGASIWRYRLEIAEDGGDSSTPLFQKKSGSYYLSVNGLKECRTNDLAYFLPRYAYIDVDKKTGGGFLGIGGFLGDFLGGLVGAVFKIVGMVAQLMVSVPILKEINQVLVFILTGGKWISSASELKVYFEKIILAAITAIVTWLTAGSGTPAWVTTMSYILAGASLFYNLSNVDEQLEAQREGEKSEVEKDQEEKNIEDMSVEQMRADDLAFMPLDRDYRDARYDVFGDQNEFQINYGMEGDMLYQL